MLHAFPLWLNLVLFGAGAVIIWWVGTRLSYYADALAERTGVGKAFIGALLLGGITSLPEGATTVTASVIGNAPLAVNNLFGGVAMQVAILAVADAVVPGRALSARIRQSTVLLQGALLIFILTLAAAGIVLEDRLMLGVGICSSVIFITSLLAFFLVHQHSTRKTWGPRAPLSSEVAAAGRRPGKNDNPAQRYSTRRLVLYTGMSGLVILIVGFVVARAGDALAVQTALGASFMGVFFLAVATSLPEVSTTLSAIRLGQFTMGFANIFGTNILDIAVLFIADLAFVGGPVLNTVGRFSLLGVLLGILVTAVYMAGLLERRKRVILGMGADSLLVLTLYMGGIFLLYTLR